MKPTNVRPAPDRAVTDIADYVCGKPRSTALARETARLCLIDSLGCALEALAYPDCLKLLGPAVPGTVVPQGARVPGTPFVLDPVRAAFSAGALVRWLDYNDAFYGATVIHPSDTISGILAVTDHLAQQCVAAGKAPPVMRDVLEAMVQAYEVAGGLAIENGFTAAGLDHTILIKIASTAVLTRLMGGTRDEVVNAVSNAWLDGHPLAAFRRKPNTGSRKSWAAADAASRAVFLAELAVKGEMGYPSAVTAPDWGFSEVLFGKQPIRLQRPYGSYVMENVLFKIAYPAAFHAQTAVECAIKLHPLVAARLGEVKRIEVRTHSSSMIILNKTGPLHNFADRDHCLQYMIAVGLIYGALDARSYEDDFAADPRIDRLRATMHLAEDKRYSREYLDPAKRTNANSVQVFFRDGTKTPKVEVEYPLGHRRRRKEGVPLLMEKFHANLARAFPEKRRKAIVEACLDQQRLEAMPVHEFVALFAA